jgi:hypothetical protein
VHVAEPVKAVRQTAVVMHSRSDDSQGDLPHVARQNDCLRKSNPSPSPTGC